MNEKPRDTEADGENKAPEPKEKKTHQIAEAITNYLHRARDIKWSCRVFVPASAEMWKKRRKESFEEMRSGEALLTSKDPVERVHGMKQMLMSMRKFERARNSQVPAVVETSLFLSLFSTFDAYTGELLSAIYERKPELFGKLNCKVDLVQVLSAKSIEELKRSVLNDTIETFRRKSYVEQFAELESTFGLTLRKFERWPDFVECTQRRNIFTHCGGVVSEQYINICKDEGYPEDKLAPIGTKLQLGGKYVLPTCELMIEVGLKLGQTLWRKILPDELTDADDHLHNTLYEALHSNNWERAKIFGDFAVKQVKASTELNRRLFIINYSIALKFSGDNEHAQKEINKVDWSATSKDFQLAVAVLQDRYAEAAKIMNKIGEKGEMVTEEAYHTWPLFNEFRDKSEFLTAYENVYKHPFVAELKRVADAAMTADSAKEIAE